MPDSAPRIFISYAAKDGSDAARELRQRLAAEGFSIWQDVVALEGGRDWWSQIEDAIRSKSVDHLVLVVSPEAMTRPVVRREIRLAKTLGKQVTPIGSGRELELGTLPRWLGHVLDPQKPEHWAQLVKALSGPSQQARTPMMAPEPPPDFVGRPKEFEALKRQLLDAKGDAAVGMTAALRGAGGYGKTTLAKALAHDPDIQEAYFDGVLWAELGNQGLGRVVVLISDLVTLITGKPPAIESREAAATALAEALGDRRFLLVIDDVWQRAALDPFLQGGTSTTRLVTTRFDRELPETAVRQAVDAMGQSEALALLSFGLPPSDVRSQVRELRALSAQLGEWAQLLKLVNGFLRNRVVKHNQGLAVGIQDVTRRLDARGLAAFDDKRAKDYDARHRSVAAVINTSLELLDQDQRARFGELGIFPEDADIPIGIVARLWGETGGLDEIATEDLLEELFDLSLLLGLDLDSRTIRFHDTTRHFLQDHAGQAGSLALHKRLIQAMGDIGGAAATAQAEADYFYRYVPDHLAGAGDRAVLDALLLDPSWLRAKLDATRSPQALFADYERHGQGQMQDFIGQTLRLTAGICARDHRQLLPQLAGRLGACSDPATPAFLAAVRCSIKPPALVPQRSSLTPPGDETARLEGHAEMVTSLVLLPDGRLTSGSYDGTIRLWDPKSGIEIDRLEGHAGWVTALAVLPDGRLVSGSRDNTIRLWDVQSGSETTRLEGHTGGVVALAMLPDGRLASGSYDGTIRLWNPQTGTETARLEVDVDGVYTLAVLLDGRLASSSRDKMIRLWDPMTGTQTARLEGHSSWVTTLAILADGRLVSGSRDNTIRLWDPKSGAETARLGGHSNSVHALAVLPDGRLASGSTDKTIRLWDLQVGAEIARLEGHTGWVMALAVLPDGRLASGSNDATIRLWTPKLGTEATRREGHTGPVTALAVLPDGRLVSSSEDRTIRLWNPKSGVETTRINGHPGGVAAIALLPDGRLASGGSHDETILLWDPTTGTQTMRFDAQAGWVTALVLLPDGQLVSGSRDNTIRLWDPKSGAETAQLEGHTGSIYALALLPDGRLVSGSNDGTIRLWDLNSGAVTAHLEGQTGPVMALAVLADGRIVSGSEDMTIRLWDPKSGSETARLEGHADWVVALAVLPDGRLASGSIDKTIRLWDPRSSYEITRLEVDAAVSSLCVLAAPGTTRCKLAAGDSLGRIHWLEFID